MAFRGCSSLAVVNFHELKELESMGGSTLYKSALVEVDLSELDKLKEISGLCILRVLGSHRLRIPS